MTATVQELKDLHKLLARSFKERIQADLEDKIPTDAATLGAAIKFLSNNNISADPADKEDLQEMQRDLSELAKKRQQRRDNIVKLAAGDLKQAEG